MKKLLLCILCSTIVTTFIGFTILFIYYVPEFISFEIIRNNDINSELSNEIAENFEDTYKNFEKTVKEQKDIYGEDFPSGGRMIFLLINIVCRSIIFTYIMSLLPGIMLGIIIYIVFVRKSKGKELLIESIFALSIILIIVFVFSLGYNTILNHIIKTSSANINSIPETYIYFLGDNNILFQFGIIFVLVYLANIIYQKVVTHKLNKALEKKV